MTSKTPKKALARATFLAHARFERFGAKRVEKCVLGRKSAQKRTFSHFWANIAKIAFWSENLESPIEIIEIPLRL